MRTRISSAFACLLFLAFLAGAGEKPRTILCTTFPLHQFTRNLAAGAERVETRLMLPADMGCPHDYALTPRDMAALEQADILVINGLGMEAFLAAPLRNLENPPLVIDSSAQIDAGLLIPFDHNHHHAHVQADHDGDFSADTEMPNPHLTVSPSMAALMVEHIAAALATADPSNAAVYQANAKRYAGELRKLAEQFAAAGTALSNRKVVETHGAFDYLARDAGLDIVAVIQPEGMDMAAAAMLELLETVKRDNPAAILVEPNFPARTAEMLARETSVPVVALDPLVSGPDDAPADYYLQKMRENVDIIAGLGRKE